MASHRKLLINPNNPLDSNSTETTVEKCLYFCNLNQNDTSSSSTTTTTTTTNSFCPTPCLAICPSICHYSLSSLISPPSISPLPNTPHNLSPLLISMLIILATVFLLIIFYILYIKLYSHYYNNNSPHQTRPNVRNNPLDNDHHGLTVVFHPIWYIPTVGLNPNEINSIAIKKYEINGDKTLHVEGTDCAVCLAEFQQGDELRVLPKCNHAFHIPCIDTCLKSHINCPLCRAPVVVDQTAEISSGPSVVGSTTVRVGVEDRDPASVIITRSASMSYVENKEIEGNIIDINNDINKGSGGGGCSSHSQRWVSRSFSCSAKIFSSRYINNNNISPSDDKNNDDNRPGPNL